MTETENPSLNGQLVPPVPCPHGKNGLWMVAVLNKAACRPRRRAPPQVSPGTFLSSCHWIRACLSGRATGRLPRWHVSHQSAPSDLLAAGLNMADASVIAPHPSTPIAFFSLLFLFLLSCVVLTPSHRRRPEGWRDVVLINAKKRRRRDSVVSPPPKPPLPLPWRIYGSNKQGQRLNLTFNSLGSAPWMPSSPSRPYLKTVFQPCVLIPPR